MDETIKSKEPTTLLIVGITPYFLEKENFWFEENLKEVLNARHSQSFFEDNVIFLEKDHSFQFSQFLRKLDEMGYERVFKVSEPGEFAQRGGIVDVFPINLNNAVRLDFLGNEVDAIKPLDINPVKNSPPIGPSGAQSAGVISNGAQNL